MKEQVVAQNPHTPFLIICQPIYLGCGEYGKIMFIWDNISEN